MERMDYLLGPMRIPFLVLAPICVLLGIGSAIWKVGEVSILHLILIFIGALAAHISVNALNEYDDFKSGLDFKTRRTPFSGGSGSLPKSPDKAHVALAVGFITLAVVGLIGLYFVYIRGWALLPLGLLGLVIVYTYTRFLTRNPLLCLVAPGMGFGVLMVMGTDFVLTGEYSITAFFASLVPFFLVSDLLLLNQFPDVEADRTIGRRHFPIAAGRKASSYLYGIFLILAYLSILIGVYLGYLPHFTLIGMLSLTLAIPVAIGVVRHRENIEKLTPFMGMNVILNLITPALVSVGFLIG
ncbi:MAG: prenyltransferase [Candidatus Cloacimonetes bacterium 4572_55]|nr:MAG: prenyltransferase [Candidatus Cloacimonetes bacterium 4572_55]